MTWQLAAYALLALVIAGGLAWYERSRPPARMVALVAALAALAVAGRLAFAAIPNVVATTDIVLITGYAVGAAPGFAVGALAAAVSNLWLGQGPWTPWEMAGWGLVGVGGAALARLTGRRLGRLGLAIACGLAGFAYGALLDFSVMVGYGGEQSLDRYLAISARGVPFNVAHAAGNVVLALAAGPALVRMISRYRSRFEFTWAKAGAVSAALLAASALALPAPRAQAAGAASAAGWLAHAQNADGGFAADPGGSSSAAMTGWASLGLEAAGRNPLDVRRGGSSAIGYLRSHLAEVRSTGDLERTILALEGAGLSARHVAGRNLATELRRRRSRSGTFEREVNLTAFGILAMRAAGTSRSGARRSAVWLRRAQHGDGGWGFRAQAPSDPDSTGAALQGLVAAGAKGPALHQGVSFLRRAQERDGGFALPGAPGSNSQSTAWAVQGVLAAHTNPARLRSRGKSPFDYLARRQASDGHYRYSSTSDQTPVWVTGQVLMAARRKPLPLAAVPRSPSPAGPPAAKTNPSTPAGSPSSPPPAPPTTAGEPAASARGGGPAGQHGPARRARQAAPQSGGSGDRPATGGSAEAPDTAAELASSRGSGTALAVWVAAGFGLLIAALIAGFLWYRRRLP
jgi:energy-coupling factor transport system substrate-specific component